MKKRIPWHWVFMFFTTLAFIQYPGLTPMPWPIIKQPNLNVVNTIDNAPAIFTSTIRALFIWQIICIIGYYLQFRKKIQPPNFTIIIHLFLSCGISFYIHNTFWMLEKYRNWLLAKQQFNAFEQFLIIHQIAIIFYFLIQIFYLFISIKTIKSQRVTSD